jgi:hypothetical protein
MLERLANGKHSRKRSVVNAAPGPYKYLKTCQEQPYFIITPVTNKNVL